MLIRITELNLKSLREKGEKHSSFNLAYVKSNNKHNRILLKFILEFTDVFLTKFKDNFKPNIKDNL